MTSPLLRFKANIGNAMSKLFFDATLTRTTPVGPAYDPTGTTIEIYSCKAIADKYGVGIRGAGLVETTDMKVTVLASTLAITPQALDVIEIPDLGFKGQIYAGKEGSQSPVSTDAANATWELRCKI